MTLDPETAAAIQAVLDSQAAAWNAGDAEGFAARASAEVVFTNILGTFSVGRAPFVAQHAHIFATFYKGSRLSQTLAHLALVRPDVAIVDTAVELSGFAHAPPGIDASDGVLRTRLEQVMVRETDGWWVAAFHNVAVGAPAGPPPGV